VGKDYRDINRSIAFMACLTLREGRFNPLTVLSTMIITTR